MDEMEIEGMEKKAKVPKLRFPGFTGEWEERKLGEVAEFSKGYGYSKDDLVFQSLNKRLTKIIKK